MKLLLGSNNPAKVQDYRRNLVHSNLELISLPGLGLTREPLEIGKTFRENALQKAKFYAESTEYPTLSDDGGLEIEALDRAPGVESKRWVGPYGTDKDRIDKAIRLMEGEPNRKAKFSIVICVYFPAEREEIFVESATHGIIAKQASANMIPNFPYRSVLFIPKFNKYFVDLTDEERERVDHRKKAYRELLLKLEPYIN